MIHQSITELIGSTPLLELSRLEEAYSLKGRLVAKMESQNPAGSAKDRVAPSMIEAAERAGALTPGSVIIEPTSGNTGVGLALSLIHICPSRRFSPASSLSARRTVTRLTSYRSQSSASEGMRSPGR